MRSSPGAATAHRRARLRAAPDSLEFFSGRRPACGPRRARGGSALGAATGGCVLGLVGLHLRCFGECVTRHRHQRQRRKTRHQVRESLRHVMYLHVGKGWSIQLGPTIRDSARRLPSPPAWHQSANSPHVHDPSHARPRADSSPTRCRRAANPSGSSRSSRERIRDTASSGRIGSLYARGSIKAANTSAMRSTPASVGIRSPCNPLG